MTDRTEEYTEAIRAAAQEQEPSGAYGDVTPSGEGERMESAIADGVDLFEEARAVEGDVIYEICKEHGIRYKTDYVYREVKNRLRDND